MDCQSRYVGTMRLISIIDLTTLVTACGSGAGESGPGGVTAGEARALDDAAEMVEKKRLPADVPRPPSGQAAAPVAPAAAN